MVIVKAPEIGDYRFKKWTKILTKVDKSKVGGYAFEGEFVRNKVEVPVGTIFLAYGEEGSRNNHKPVVEMFEAKEGGTLASIYKKDDLDPHWALDVRNDIEKILSTKKPPQKTEIGVAVKQEATKQDSVEGKGEQSKAVAILSDTPQFQTALQVHKSRTVRSQKQDEAHRSKITILPNDSAEDIWRKHKESIDIEGIDTPRSVKVPKIKMPKMKIPKAPKPRLKAQRMGKIIHIKGSGYTRRMPRGRLMR